MDILEQVRVDKDSGVTELRLDWGNGLHHAVRIDEPCGPEQVIEALYGAVGLIRRGVQFGKLEP